MRCSIGVVVLSVCMSVMTGCGSSTPDAVDGTVTLDGIPLPTGRITLIPTDDRGTANTAEIKDGKFQIRIQPGPKVVQITSEKIISREKVYPNDPTSPEYDKKEQILPARYNSASELKMTAKFGEPMKFDLISAPETKSDSNEPSKDSTKADK